MLSTVNQRFNGFDILELFYVYVSCESYTSYVQRTLIFDIGRFLFDAVSIAKMLQNRRHRQAYSRLSIKMYPQFSTSEMWHKWIYRPCNRISFRCFEPAAVQYTKQNPNQHKHVRTHKKWELFQMIIMYESNATQCKAMRAPFYSMTYFNGHGMCK